MRLKLYSGMYDLFIQSFDLDDDVFCPLLFYREMAEIDTHDLI